MFSIVPHSALFVKLAKGTLKGAFDKETAPKYELWLTCDLSVMNDSEVSAMARKKTATQIMPGVMNSR